MARNDPTWKTIEVGCWTPETADQPVDAQVSVWPERYPTDHLRDEKRAAVAINKLSVFAREMELRLTSPELADFRGEWLQYYTEGGTVPNCVNILSIDPTPPPSDKQMEKGYVGDDYEVLHVWGRRGDNYFLQERRSSRGQTPDWTIVNLFELALKYRVVSVVVESIAYQRVLKWLIEKEMARRRTYFAIVPFVGKNKYARIRATLAGPASHGHIWVRPDDTPFIAQFETYPSSDHDDELDAASIALSALVNPYAAASGSDPNLDDDEPLQIVRGAP